MSDDEGSIVQCECNRGSYNDAEYSSCYECFLDRRSSYLACIFCGRWHSPKFSTCYRCRQESPGRDEAGRNLRQDILIRDDYTCTQCGEHDYLQIDHIKPCASGGQATPWNLQVLCSECNRMKGRTWSDGCRWDAIRVEQMRLYFTFGWSLLDDAEREQLCKDATRYDDQFDRYANYREWMGQEPLEPPQWALEMADRSPTPEGSEYALVQG